MTWDGSWHIGFPRWTWPLSHVRGVVYWPEKRWPLQEIAGMYDFMGPRFWKWWVWRGPVSRRVYELVVGTPFGMVIVSLLRTASEEADEMESAARW
jgi:hypothetical protein